MRIILSVLAFITPIASAVPDGYISAGTTDKGKTKWFMHHEVSVRTFKTIPNDFTVLAKTWMDDSIGQGVGYNQAFNCNNPGESFDIVPSGDGGLSLSDPTYFPKDSIGYGLWQFACDLAYPPETYQRPANSLNSPP
jgi:hypothetical protein